MATPLVPEAKQDTVFKIPHTHIFYVVLCVLPKLHVFSYGAPNLPARTPRMLRSIVFVVFVLASASAPCMNLFAHAVAPAHENALAQH